MITDAILAFFLNIATAAFNALPAWTPTVDSNSLGACRSWIISYNQVAPVSEMLIVFGIFIVVFGIMQGVSVVKFVLNLIRGAGT